MPADLAAVRSRIAELRKLHADSDLDPLQSHRIISPGYTHMANLTERIKEGCSKGGRGRCIAMIPRCWSDWIAAAENAVPILCDLIEAAMRERETATAPEFSIDDYDTANRNLEALVSRFLEAV